MALTITRAPRRETSAVTPAPRVNTLVGCLLAGGLMTGFAAGATGVGVQAGEHYTDLQVNMGTDSPGLYMQGSWMHNDDRGERAGLGMGLGLPLGDFLLSGGGKVLYLNPESEGEGWAMAMGGRLAWPMTQHMTVFAEGYYSPDSLSGGVDHYREADAGMRWTVLRPVSLSVGYRYTDIAGKDGHRSRVLADGMYVGGDVMF